MNRPVAALFCDCNTRSGVWSYTLRMLDLFRSLGYATRLATHRPRDGHERSIHAELSAAADEVFSIDDRLGEDRQVRLLVRWLEEAPGAIFVPNYRKITYAAAARVVRRYPLRVLGLCHADQPSYYEVLVRYASVVSLFVCAVERTREELSRRLPAEARPRVVRIPHAVPRPDDRHAAPATGGFRVIYHGRLREEQKHCSEILRVASMLRDRGSDVRFTLLGDGPDAPQYRRTIEREALEEYVTILPSRPWPRVWDLLLEHQLGILTSAFEGFCYSAAECLSAGLPVAAYDCGSVLDDYVEPGRNGCVVPWGDASALADYIDTLADDEATWRVQSARARAIADRRFACDAVAHGYREAIDAIAFEPGWPRLRPSFVPPRGKSPRAFLERIGRRRGWWAA